MDLFLEVLKNLMTVSSEQAIFLIAVLALSLAGFALYVVLEVNRQKKESGDAQ